MFPLFILTPKTRQKSKLSIWPIWSCDALNSKSIDHQVIYLCLEHSNVMNNIKVHSSTLPDIKRADSSL